MEESKLCGRKKKSKMEFCKYINNGKAEKWRAWKLEKDGRD
jgi:hypothetical protein